MHGNLFFHKYGAFSQQITNTLLQKAFTNIARHSRCSMLQAIGTCALVLFVRCSMIVRNNYNQSQLGKE